MLHNLRALAAGALLLVLCAATAAAQAADKLAFSPMFSDNAVLQRDQTVPVWGVASPSAAITARLRDQEKATRADAQGKWKVKFAPLPAGGPYELSVTDGATSVKLANVMLGDVWLCSGQSNMAFPTIQATNGPAEVARYKEFPNLRFYSVSTWGSFASKPAEATGGTWKLPAPDSVTSFTAIGMFFAREISTTTLTGVTIGLIDSSRGATRIESWMSKEALVPYEKTGLRDSAFGATISSCWNGMIHPIQPYALRGVIWSQGASNAGKPEQYKLLFPAMIKEWRQEFEQPNLPFLFAQYPNYAHRFDGNYFMGVREGQLQTWQKVPHTGMAVTIDAGDPDNVHPPDKHPLGHRLALLARAKVYGQDIVCYGPIIRSAESKNGVMVVQFDYVDGGLVDKNGGKLAGFELAGKDKKFVAAEAAIDGETVAVKSAQVPSPEYVRYAWAPNPPTDLHNAAGLPASPFRTDTDPLPDQTDPKEIAPTLGVQK